MGVDYPLDREENDDEINEDQEAIELEEMFGKDVSFASGITIPEHGTKSQPSTVRIKR